MGPPMLDLPVTVPKLSVFVSILYSTVKFQGPRSIPEHWDPSALPDPGFKVWDPCCLSLERRVFLGTGKCEQAVLKKH